VRVNRRLLQHEPREAELTAEQWRQYVDDSVVRDLSEIDKMPEPTRSWARPAVEQARARAEAQIARAGQPRCLVRRLVRTTEDFWAALDLALPSAKEPSWHAYAARDLPEVLITLLRGGRSGRPDQRWG
jgi:hypothetical protein